MKIYFLPIKSENLAEYFASAIVKPAKYCGDRVPDIQTDFENFLFLSTKHAVTGKDIDCSLEIVLTEEEEKQLSEQQLNEDCWLLNKPLPISRIKSIFFVDENQMQQTIKFISANTAFIPKNIIKSIMKFEYAEANFDTELLSKIEVIEWKEKISLFNRTLGGLALMRIVTQENMSFSENYFSTLASYNEKIKELIKGTTLKERKIFNEAYNKTIRNYSQLKITDEQIQQIAKEENQKLEQIKYKNTINLTNLKDATYILAFVHDTKVNDNDEGRDKIDGYIVNRFQDIKKGEEIAFYYGYNKGYAVFAKEYKTKIDNTVSFKYKLDTQLDYYTIESIYQFYINDKKENGDFPYIADWCNNQYDEVKDINFRKSEKEYKCIVLDQLVIGKKKAEVGSEEWLENLFSKFFPKISEFLISGGLKDWLKDFVYEIINQKEEEFQDRLEEQKEIYEQKEIEYKNKIVKLQEQPKAESHAEIYVVREAQVQYGKQINEKEKIETLIKEIKHYLKEKNGAPAKGEINKILDRYNENNSRLPLEEDR
jgi:hypothetical protein